MEGVGFVEKEEISLYLKENMKYFESVAIPMIRKKLESVNDETLFTLQTCSFKDPTLVLLLSIFLGYIGIDRFMIGDIGLGILKLVTFGGFGIWWFVDLFLIIKKTKQKNFALISIII